MCSKREEQHFAEFLETLASAALLQQGHWNGNQCLRWHLGFRKRTTARDRKKLSEHAWVMAWRK